MNRNQVIKKLKSEVKARQKTSETPEKINIRNVLVLRYVIRDNAFVNYKGSCGLDLNTMEGHSYRWYSLVKKIKGTVYLNDYRYSVQTSKHIWQVASVMRRLGIKFKRLSAPSGLQDLDAALDHAIEEYAKACVRKKYQRQKGNWNQAVKTWKSDLDELARLGFVASKKRIDLALFHAEEDRKKANESIRMRSKFQREQKAKAREEYVKKALAHIDELKRTKYAYRRIWKSLGYSYVLAETATLSVDTDYLMDLKSVPGNSKKACLAFLKVMARLNQSNLE